MTPKRKRGASMLESLPTDLLTDILARVASKSAEDVCKLKLLSKTCKQAAEDPYVYRNAHCPQYCMSCLGNFDIWQLVFFDKCFEAHHIGLLFREAMYNWVQHNDVDTAVRYLATASKNGFTATIYASCIVRLLSGVTDLEREASNELHEFMSKTQPSILQDCKDKFFEVMECASCGELIDADIFPPDFWTYYVEGDGGVYLIEYGGLWPHASGKNIWLWVC